MDRAGLEKLSEEELIQELLKNQDGTTFSIAQEKLSKDAKIRVLSEAAGKLDPFIESTFAVNIGIEALEIEGISSSAKTKIIESIEVEFTRGEAIIHYVDEAFSENEIKRLIKTFDTGEIKDKVMMSILMKCNVEKNFIQYCLSLMTPEHIKNNIEQILRILYKDNLEITEEDIQTKTKIFLKCFERNEDISETLNWNFLDSKYLKIFGQEIYEQLACYPGAQEFICQIGEDDKKLGILKKCFESYINKNGQQQWAIIVEKLITSINQESFNELIEGLDSETLDDEIIGNLNRILMSDNIFNITNAEQLKKYDLIKEEVLRAIKENDDETLNKYPLVKKMAQLEKKKLVILETLFGIDINQANSIIKMFGEYIDQISTKDDEKSQCCVDYVNCLKRIMQEENEEALDSLISKLQNMDFTIEDINPIAMEGELKKTYFREMKKGLFKIEDGRKLKGKNMYEVGTDFRMIVHSLHGCGSTFNQLQHVDGRSHNEVAGNFREDWNRKSIRSRAISTSYIANDCIGTTSVNRLCYVFNQVDDDALMAIGENDISTDTRGLNVNTSGIFCTPQEFINRIGNYSSNGYSELVMERRNRRGEKYQPDAIFTFRRKGQFLHEDDVMQAQEDWGDIPVFFADIDKCLISEKIKIYEMMKKSITTGDKELISLIVQKIKNNRITISTVKRLFKEEPEFTEDLMETFLDGKSTVSIEDIDARLQSLREELERLEEETEYEEEDRGQEENQSGKVGEDDYREAYDVSRVEDMRGFIRNVVRLLDLDKQNEHEGHESL